MAGKVIDSANKMFSSIGAIQTLIENFPMGFTSFNTLNINVSFDVIALLFRLLGVDRDKIVEIVTNALCGNIKDSNNGGGFIDTAENMVKMALEANIMKILNCTTNPIISNDLLDKYYLKSDEISADNGKYSTVLKSGDGILIDVSEIDITGVLNKNPFLPNEDKFYFDVEDKNATNIYKSTDFNAFLWYIINKSDKTQDEELVWDNRYNLKNYESNSEDENKLKKKNIIRCTYIDDIYPNTDKIKVQICGAVESSMGNNHVYIPGNYFKTRKLKDDNKNTEWALNKTIFEFNHDFLFSLKLYEPKVMIAEMVEQLIGNVKFEPSIGYSINEEIINGKIQEIIKKIIVSSDTEINDCFFSFSNEEYNNMLEKSEKNRFNIINNGYENIEVDPNEVLSGLTINSSTTLQEDKVVISKTINDIIATPAKDPSSTMTDKLSIDANWEIELLNILIYPFIRPLFTPKVMFLLAINQKLMGGLEDAPKSLTELYDSLINGLLVIIKDIIIKLKDLLIDMFLNYILKELTPLLAIFSSQLLLETLMLYRDLLMQILDKCLLGLIGGGQKIVGVIDDVNYADIIPRQTEPNQSIC